MWNAAALTDRGLGITPVCTFRCGCRDYRLDSGKTSTQVRFTVSFCSPALRFHVTSPCRHCRHCGAPEPRKEKQKCYDHRCAVLIFHRFRSFLSVFTRYCVRSGTRLRRNWLASLEHCRLRQRSSGLGKGWTEKPRISDAHPLQLRARLGAT